MPKSGVACLEGRSQTLAHTEDIASTAMCLNTAFLGPCSVLRRLRSSWNNVEQPVTGGCSILPVLGRRGPVPGCPEAVTKGDGGGQSWSRIVERRETAEQGRARKPAEKGSPISHTSARASTPERSSNCPGGHRQFLINFRLMDSCLVDQYGHFRCKLYSAAIKVRIVP